MIQWLRNLWWKRQRQIDLKILWPACKEQAPTIDHAKAAFAYHAFHDPAWIGFYGESELIRVIGELR